MILHKKYIRSAISILQYSRLIVKSDRINALRKQYDAFLEEDRMRKDRNDFILDKLDKMRFCTATLPLRSIPTSHMSQKTGIGFGKLLEKPSIYENHLLPSSLTQHLPVEVTKKHLDDLSFLREISKKYILIPKLNATSLKECPETVNPVTDYDSDWKSKYDILNQIKQKDKVEHDTENSNTNKYTYEDYKSSNESFIDQCNSEKKLNTCTSSASDTKHGSLLRFKDEKPEKDVSDVKIVNEILNVNKNNENIQHQYAGCEMFNANVQQYGESETQNLSLNIISDHEYKVNATNLKPAVTAPTSFIENQREEFEKQNIFNENVTNSGVAISSQMHSNSVQMSDSLPQQTNSSDMNSKMNTQKPVDDVDEDVLSSQHNFINYTEQIEPQTLAKENTNDNIIAATGDVSQNVNTEYPIDIINVSEFTPNEGVDLQDGVNINPHITHEETSLQREQPNENTEEQAENPVDVSGIEEFDAEQREMFYSEQPHENYAYDQTNDETAYQDYAQNENYQQNEEYAYYDNVQPQQTYPAEVNEFEETSQPYDQTYQEQYATYDQKGYAQQENHEQQPQQYEGMPDVDPNLQPETVNLQYEPNDVEPRVIEQQLDDEQGYIEEQDSENLQNKLLENTPNEDLNIAVDHELNNSEIQANIIQENTLNN